MAKETVDLTPPLTNDGVPQNQPGDINQDHVNYDPIQIYSERAPYSKTSKASEVFGPRIQEYLNGVITSYAKLYDGFMASGKKEAASIFENGIKKISTQVDHLSNLKDEWMMMRGGGQRGKSTVSNITDPRWPDAFFTEQGDISITPDYQIMASVPGLGAPKLVNDIAIDWESKGDGEGRYMSGIQDMQEAGARGDKSPPFDVDYFTSNLLKEYWPQALADDWGGIYALQDEILPKMIESNGGTMEGLNTSIESFNPKHDNRLHNYYTKRLKKAFNPNFEQETEEVSATMSEKEKKEADKLIERFTGVNELTRETRGVIKKERRELGRI